MFMFSAITEKSLTFSIKSDIFKQAGKQAELRPDSVKFGKPFQFHTLVVLRSIRRAVGVFCFLTVLNHDSQD